MKSALVGCTILALALVTYSVAQNDQEPPATLLKLFKVGDHVGVSRTTDRSRFVLYLSTEKEVERAKSYAAKQKENEEQLKKLEEEWKAATLSAQKFEISKRMVEFEPPRLSIQQVVAVGQDFLGLKRLGSEDERYIPLGSIVEVIRKPNEGEAEASK